MIIEDVIFYVLAAIILFFSIMAVKSRLVVRAATYLLFVLLATAGLYLLLDYTYLFTVQIAVYAGGIMVLFIMAIFLTHKPGKDVIIRKGLSLKAALPLTVTGLFLCGYIIVKNITKVYSLFQTEEIPMLDIGRSMMGTEKYQYLLPFEVISLLLLACIIGAIMIAREENSTKD